MSLKDNALVEYFRKSYQELEKVTWLTRKQMVQSSVLVLSISALVTGFITLVDYLFHNGYIKLIDSFLTR